MGRRWLETLLHIHDTPERTAAAFALGVFFSFSPFLGLQVVASFGLAFLFKLNRVAVFAGLNANLPWFLVPWYALTTSAAAALLGTRLPPDLSGAFRALFALSVLTRAFWEQALTLIAPLAWPFVLGSTLGAAVVAAIAYYIARTVLVRRVSRLHGGGIG